MGLTPHRDDVGGACGSNGYNILLSIPGEGMPLLFSAHLDTVSPGNGIEPVLDNGIIRSAGDTILGADDKSGVAAIMEALSVILYNGTPHRPIEILFSICEEIGLLGAKNADYSFFNSKEAVVMDGGPVSDIINRAPAMLRIHFEISGKSAHAGVEPEKGAHALKAAAEAISGIHCGYVGEDSVMNVGRLICEGKTNIVPAFAEFDMEIRSFSEESLHALLIDAEAKVAAACDHYGVIYSMQTKRNSDVVYVPENSRVVEDATAFYRTMGMTTRLIGTFGGSDATWLNANGIAAINLGAGITDAHSTKEHLAVDDFFAMARVVLAMMTATD